jgi:hypothetical protein
LHEVAGTVLEERTHAPISGAEIYLTQQPKYSCKSDSAGRFRLRSIHNWHYAKCLGAAGASEMPAEQDWDPYITISHTNYAPRTLDLQSYPDRTILLKKLGELSQARPWLTFNGDGIILQDAGAERYLKPGDIRITAHHMNSAGVRPAMLHIGFAQRVYDLKVTEVDGFERADVDSPIRLGLDWEFRTWYPRDDIPTGAKDASRVFRLEFTP